MQGMEEEVGGESGRRSEDDEEEVEADEVQEDEFEIENEEEHREEEEGEEGDAELAEAIRIEGLSQFQPDWAQPLQAYINNWLNRKRQPHGSRQYMRNYFRTTDKLTTRTLRAFQTLARLAPVGARRDTTAGELVQRIERLNKGCPGPNKAKGKSIGGTDSAQDNNLRLEIKVLIKKLNANPQDSEAEDEEEDDGEETKDTQSPETTCDTERPIDLPDVPVDEQSQPVIQDPDEEEETPAQQAIRGIYENWDNTMRDYLPDGAHPQRDESDWPLDLLQDTLEFSSLTARQNVEDIRGTLDKAFGPTKRYLHKKSLTVMRAAIGATRNGRRSSETGARAGGSGGDAGDDPGIVESAATTLGVVNGQGELQAVISTAQTSTPASAAPRPSASPTATKRSIEEQPDSDAHPQKQLRLGQVSHDAASTPPDSTQVAVQTNAPVTTNTPAAGNSSSTGRHQRSIVSPDYLSPKDKHRHREAVQACRRANSELV
ncbi:hypothetical protein N0V86_008454 [Didymella sp. IMI 355093]|nr:hypothetical protein N0V86_008454 [Didymella sp. IMI 355093]